MSGRPRLKSTSGSIVVARRLLVLATLLCLPAAEAQRPSAGFASLGESIGLSGIEVSGEGPRARIYLGGRERSPFAGPFFRDRYWLALELGGDTPFVQVRHVSEFLPQGIVRLALGSLRCAGCRDLAVALADGAVIVYDEATGAEVRRYVVPAGLEGMALADLDRDGIDEVLLAETGRLRVYGADGVERWSLAGVGGRSVAVGQMDSDAGLEIALGDGSVVDADTRTVQWAWPHGTVDLPAVVDLDGDGRAELVGGERLSNEGVWAYDVETGAARWHLPVPDQLFAIALADLDGTVAGTPSHLIVARHHTLEAYRLRDLELDWTHSWSPSTPGPTTVAVANVDRDPALEVIWGSGIVSSGSDHLYVLDSRSLELQLRSEHFDGPFAGPLAGDLDGDGRDEIVAASWSSESGYSGGRVVVLSARDLSQRAISPADATAGNVLFMSDLEVADADADGRDEVYAAHDLGYRATVTVYEWANGGLELTRTLTDEAGSLFVSVDVADIDQDGRLELICARGKGAGPVGEEGLFLAVYDLENFTLEWVSPRLGTYYSTEVPQVRIGDVDGDLEPEIVLVARRTGDAWIFDGDGGFSVLPGIFTAVEIVEPSLAGGAPRLLLGDENGNVNVFQYEEGAYVLQYAHFVIPARVDGLTWGPNGRLWAAGAGELSRLRVTPRQATLEWTSPIYGWTLGNRVLFQGPGAKRIVTSGTYGVHRLTVGGDASSRH